MLKKISQLLLILAALALMALPIKGWAYDWNQQAGNFYQNPGYPGRYNSGYNQLAYARASAQAQYDAAVARGDRKGAKHLGNAIRELDRQIAASNASAGANAYTYEPYGYSSYRTPHYGYDSSYNQLVYARASAQAQFDAAVARGDRKGAKHLGNAIRKLDRQIAANDTSVSSYPYNSYSPSSSYSPFANSADGSIGGWSGVDVKSAASMMLPLLQQFMGN